MTIRERIAKLIDVKSLCTLTLVGVFAYLSVIGRITTEQYVRAASDAVLTQFERPADMSESVKIKRAGFAEAFLREFGGQAPVVIISDMPDIMAGVLTIDGKSYAVRLRQM